MNKVSMKMIAYAPREPGGNFHVWVQLFDRGGGYQSFRFEATPAEFAAPIRQGVLSLLQDPLAEQENWLKLYPDENLMGG